MSHNRHAHIRPDQHYYVRFCPGKDMLKMNALYGELILFVVIVLIIVVAVIVVKKSGRKPDSKEGGTTKHGAGSENPATNFQKNDQNKK